MQAPIHIMRMEYDKPTKRKYRYQAPEGAPVTGTLYLRKSDWPDGPPGAIHVEIEEAHDG